jgi:DNA polymerase III epsilon subunit family exonuclease
LINPHRPICPAAYAINGISGQMLKDAPDAREILPDFLRFAENSCLAAYNAPFDIGFLNNELRLAGMRLPPETIIVDILAMARRLLPSLERYALWFVAQALGLNSKQQHRAFSDSEMAGRIFEKLTDILQQKGICDFANFVSLFGLDSAVQDNLNNAKIARIQKALELKSKLRIKYLSRTPSLVSEREIMPLQIKQERNRVYLVAFCYLRNQERTFSIDGILHLEII